MEKKEDIIKSWFHSIAGKCIGLSRRRSRDRSPLGPPNLMPEWRNSRRVVLKSRCPKGREGAIPSSGTTLWKINQ